MRIRRRPSMRSEPGDRLRAVRALPDAPASLQPLLEALEDPSPEVVKAALARLPRYAGPMDAEYLRERLLTVDLSVIRDWAAALLAMGDPISVITAIRGLRATSVGTRIAAAVALGELCDPRAVIPLIDALADPIAGVRRCAVESLAMLGPNPGSAEACRRMLLDEEAGVRTAAVDAVVGLAADSELDRWLRPVLDDPSLRVRRRLGDHAGCIGRLMVSRLLTDPQPDVRTAAAWSFEHTPRTDVADLLAARLRDAAWTVRRAACRALGATRDRAAAADLLPMLDDPHPTVRSAALNALTDVCGGGLARTLGAALGDASPRLRRALVYALAWCPASESVPLLAACAADPDDDVRLAVAHLASSLRTFGADPVLERLEHDPAPAVRYAVAAALARPAVAQGGTA
jgi:HEAT repeat protein